MSPRVPLFQLRCGSCLLLLSVVLVCRTTIAVPIYPGETVTLPGTNLVDRPELDGTVQATAIVPFADLNNLYNGTVEISVVQDPLGSAGVEQYRILSFDASESGFEIVGWDSSYQASGITMPLDVDYFDDTPGDRAPTTASLPPGLQPNDFVFSSVRFNFLVPVTPGETSRTMCVVANADIVIRQLFNYGAGVLVRDPSGAISRVPFASFAVIIP